jgi:hypothetical protein
VLYDNTESSSTRCGTLRLNLHITTRSKPVNGSRSGEALTGDFFAEKVRDAPGLFCFMKQPE